MSARQINATVGSLLGFLHEGPQSGWDLVTTAHTMIGDFWNLTQSQIYRELSSMADHGLITVDALGPRDRRAYRLTDTGRAAFAEWLAREPGEEQIRYPLLLTLAFGRHLAPQRLASILLAHRAIHVARLQNYRAIAVAAQDGGAQPRDLITVDFGVRYESAVVDWFDHLPAELTAPQSAAEPPPPGGAEGAGLDEKVPAPPPDGR